MSRRKILQAQLFYRMSQMIRCHAEIVSGAYKLRGIGSDDMTIFRNMSDDEKLRFMMQQLKVHEERVHDVVRAIEEDE